MTGQINIQSLVKLGLTKDEARTYSLLLEEGSLSAKEISDQLGILPNAVYRLAKTLKNKDFIVFLETSPQTFQAIPPQVALEAFSKTKAAQIEELKTQAIKDLGSADNSQTGVDILTSKHQFFSNFNEMAEQAKEEILIISIGEDVPDSVKLSTRDALERGVKIKIIFHKFDKDNELLVKTWAKMGCEVRHFPAGGFHLNIFDGKRSVLVANNPKNTAERSGMVINSEALSKALKDYFSSVWEKAVPVSRI